MIKVRSITTLLAAAALSAAVTGTAVAQQGSVQSLSHFGVGV